MRKAVILIILLGMASFYLQAQEKSARDHARERIMSLHDGVLLVRLQTRSKSIETIRERGMVEKADQMQAELKEKNEEIIHAFEKEYDFSRVFFFQIEDSKAITEGDYSEVAFFDFQRDTIDPDLGQTYFLTAEFGRVQSDATDSGFGALIIMNDQFVQLQDPFPSYTRTFETLFFLRRDAKMVVRKMNENLHYFY